MSAGDSARRILWIVGLYRAICGAALFGIALLVDLQASRYRGAQCLHIGGSRSTSCSGCVTFWWIQRDPLADAAAGVDLGAARAATSSSSR